jgi:hypothetical protein
MTLFTAEGLLRDQQRPERDTSGSLWPAYQRWLLTQNEDSADAHQNDGWLISHQFLHRERAPGNTCLSALSAGLDRRACGSTTAKAAAACCASHPPGFPPEDKPWKPRSSCVIDPSGNWIDLYQG